MKSSQLIAIIIAIVAAIWILSGIILGTGASADQDEAEQARAENHKQEPVSVRIQNRTSEPYRSTIKITGQTKPSQSVELKAEIDGPIEEILVDEGTRVEKGQILARLELRDKKARVDEARELVKQRELQFKAAQALEKKGFNTEITLAQASANFEAAKAALAAAQNEYNKVEIKAPFAGIVEVQDIDVGDFLTTMGGARAFKVIDLDPLEIDGYVTERNIGKIHKGMNAKAVFLNGETLEGNLSYVAPAADEDTRTFRVILSAPNPDHLVKAGLTASLEIPTDAIPAHKISPSILTLNDAGQIGVKIVNEQNIVEFKTVDILSDLPAHMWVGGLPDQVKLITVGQEFVQEGEKVTPVEAENEGLL